jgi:hypothetical protein
MSSFEFDETLIYSPTIPVNREKNTDPEEYEKLIEHVHFIWLGSFLTKKGEENIRKWVVDYYCGFKFYLWYDALLIEEDEISKFKSFARECNDTINIRYFENEDKVMEDPVIHVCDFRQYIHPEDMVSGPVPIFRLLEIYNGESGFITRAGLDDYTKDIKNWAMASDVLRYIILYMFEGFYMDVDILPVNLCEYFKDKKIKTCPVSFCINDRHPKNEFDYDKGVPHHVREEGYFIFDNNNALYYKSNKDHDRVMIKVLSGLYDLYRKNVLDNFYYYVFGGSVSITVKTTGPLFLDTFPKSEILTLRNFVEDTSINENTSWWMSGEKYIKNKTYSLMINKLLSDDDELFKYYCAMHTDILLKNEEYIILHNSMLTADTNEDVENFIKKKKGASDDFKRYANKIYKITYTSYSQLSNQVFGDIVYKIIDAIYRGKYRTGDDIRNKDYCRVVFDRDIRNIYSINSKGPEIFSQILEYVYTVTTKMVEGSESDFNIHVLVGQIIAYINTFGEKRTRKTLRKK